MKLVITGAAGYIGAQLVARALASGHQVIAATRRAPGKEIQWLHFDLADPEAFHLPKDSDALIHLAARTSAFGVGEAVDEVHAAMALLDMARAIGARFVFVSSQAASEDAPTDYGRVKWEIERRVLASGGVVVRLGQVYGGPELGLFGALVGLVRDLPVLPAFVPPPAVQPIHVDDCAAGLLAIAAGSGKVGTHALGSSESVSFTKLLRSIARHRIRRPRLFVPVPIAVVRPAISVLSLFSSSAFGLMRLRSLFSLPPLPAINEDASLDVKMRPLCSGMHPSGDNRRRLLVAEGSGLLNYVLRAEPGGSLVRRYVRTIEALREGRPASWPLWIFRRPLLLASLDGHGGDPTQAIVDLRWRIAAAALIAEASVQGYERYLKSSRPRHAFLAFAAVGLAILSEGSLRLLSMVLVPALRLSIGRDKA